jgi:ABC-type antimicrobial peptide transport system permease subunit
MTMLDLSLRSLRARPGAFAASFGSMLLGAVIVMAFASLIDTSAGPGVSSSDEETLVTMASVVGGWGLIIVVFSVASMLTLSVRQRGAEMALLKSVGATPRQLRRMIVGETALLSVVASSVAIPLAIPIGRLVFELLQDTDQVGENVGYGFGGAAVVLGMGIPLVASTIAAFIAARRVTRLQAADAIRDAALEDPRMGRKRIVAACVFLALGLDTAVVTMTVFNGEGSDAMQTAGQASIWTSIGLALFAPVLVRRVTGWLARPAERLGGASGYLGVQNVRRRTKEMAGAVMPIILFTGIATGTIYMQSIENAAMEGLVKTNEQRNIETLNFVVVGMIALFAAIMVVNTLVSATMNRRREFGQQRLAGSTPPQVLGMVGLESVVLAATGVLFGALASIATIVPYSVARTQTVIPDQTIGILLGVVVAAAALTLAASLGATRRAIAVPAVRAVAAA